MRARPTADDFAKAASYKDWSPFTRWGLLSSPVHRMRHRIKERRMNARTERRRWRVGHEPPRGLRGYCRIDNGEGCLYCDGDGHRDGRYVEVRPCAGFHEFPF